MTRSKKVCLGFGLLLLWGLGVWMVFRPAPPTAEEKFGEWLSTRRHAAPAGRLEVWANRFRIDYFSKVRREKDLRFTEELLADGNYAVVVASWLDSEGRIAPGVSATWPHVRSALEEMMGTVDPERLDAALSRADEARFATWDRTIVRSAYRSGAQEELAPIVKALRDFEQVHRSGLRRMESLQRLSGLYALSPTNFARALAEEEDPAMEALLDLVMQDLGFSRSGAHEALLSEWKTGGIPEADMGLLERILGNAKLGLFRNEVFIWLALGRESEEWRTRHRAKLGELLDQFHRTDPDFARSVASDLVDEVIKRSDQLTADWRLVTGILLSKIDPEPDLKVWISDKSGPNFMWLCHQVDAEGLLNRSVRVWNDSVQNRSAWIGEFIDAEHFGAACALIEGVKEDVVYIRSRKESPAESRNKTLEDYLGLYERMFAHADNPQVKGFIHLELGITAMENLKRNDERSLAREEVLKAIGTLTEAGSTNGNLLEQTVSRLVELDHDLFEAGRPCFDKWRGGVTSDEILDRLLREKWGEGESAWMIWKFYFRDHVTRSELPELADVITGLIRRSSDDNTSHERTKRISDLLGVSEWEFSESGDLELASWMLTKMIGESQWSASAKWMSARVDDFRVRFPKADDTIVMRKIHDVLLTELNRRSVDDGLRWLGAVLNEEVSGASHWPTSFEQIIHRSPGSLHPENLQVIEECFNGHPLRGWIARRLLLDGVPTTKEWADNRDSILGSAREPWLKAVINEHLDHTFDLDAFARDMAEASPGARRFFSENPFLPRKGNSFPKHPSGRELTEAERMTHHLWEAEQTLERVEKGGFFDAAAFKWLLSDLFDLAEGQSQDPRLRSFVARLQNAPVEVNTERLSDFEVEMLREMQTRAALLVAPQDTEA